MNNDTDVMEQLTALRPDPDSLGRRWSAERRAELVALILEGEAGTGTRLRHLPARPVHPRGRSRRHRLVVASTLVAVAILAAIVAPTLLPQGAPGGASPAAAAALESLALVAADTPADTAGPGEFIRTVVRNHQVGVFVDSDPDDPTRDLDVRSESWTGSDGDVWRRTTSVARDGDNTILRSGDESLYFPAGSGEAGAFREVSAPYGYPLPTEPDELLSHLRDRVQGSSSTDEAVFLALGDVLRSRTAPAVLRSAALSALARIDHVTLGTATADSLGRTVQQFVLRDETARAGVEQAYLIDPRTAQLVEERTTQPRLVSTTTVLTTEVVTSVPTTVLRDAVTLR